MKSEEDAQEQGKALPSKGKQLSCKEILRQGKAQAQGVEAPQPPKGGEVEDVNILPIGEGVFGKIYNQFKGKIKEAFGFLFKQRGGDLLGVFHRDEVGDIDLVWGDKSKTWDWNILLINMWGMEKTSHLSVKWHLV